MKPDLKLVYFNAMGLAETSRILLALAEVEYIDYRFPLEMVDKNTYNRDEFLAAKAEGKLDSSMGKLPLLHVTDKKGNTAVIPQSKAIERYISNRWGFMGSNNLEAARIDAVCECVRDINDKYQKMRNDNEKLDEYFSSGLAEDLNALVKVMDDTVDKYAVGNKLSLADVTIYSFITRFDNKEALNIAGKIDKIRKIVMQVAGRPQLIVWTQKRPKTLF